MPKLAGRPKSERMSISFREGQIDALKSLAISEGHGNVSLVVQNITETETKRRRDEIAEAAIEHQATPQQVPA